MLKGFKEFILRGNIVDLAVAVVIGIAFGALVTAFVASPLIAWATGGRYYLAQRTPAADGVAAEPCRWSSGNRATFCSPGPAICTPQRSAAPWRNCTVSCLQRCGRR